MAVSRFDRFPIQINFAENRNWTTSPNLAADPALLVGGPTRGRGKTQRKQLKGGDPRVPTGLLKYHILQTSSYRDLLNRLVGSGLASDRS